MRPRSTAHGAAALVARVFERLIEGDLPVAIRAWDGSMSGPAAGPTVIIRSPRALRSLLWAPGEIGLARAWVSGDLDIEGDLGTALRPVLARFTGGRRIRPKVADAPLLLRTLRRLGVLGLPPRPPASEARPRGKLHSPGRDRQSISHHYDLSNDFYKLVLDPSMAYSCGLWTSHEPSYTVADAQRDKCDLVCRKLQLTPGSRLLDVGSGWGALAIHAAREYGALVDAVTLSQQQFAFTSKRVAEFGLGDRVTTWLRDYRDLDTRPGGEHHGSYDAVASLEMGEHVGPANYPAYVAIMVGALRTPGGRLVLQQMSRGLRAPGGGAFIERYIAPDMHMRPVGETLGLLRNAGVEIDDVTDLREHYVRTIRAWEANLNRNIEAATELAGGETVRVWRLYLAGSTLAFEGGRMGVEQILATRR